MKANKQKFTKVLLCQKFVLYVIVCEFGLVHPGPFQTVNYITFSLLTSTVYCVAGCYGCNYVVAPCTHNTSVSEIIT